MRIRGLLTVVGVLIPAMGAAEVLSVPVIEAAVVGVREGESRVLLRMTMPDLSSRAVTRATLRCPAPAVLEGRLAVWVRAARPDDSIDAELTSRTSLERGGSEVTCDVTNVLLGVRDGTAVSGMVVTIPEWEGDGFPEVVAEALRVALAEATVDIQYRRMSERGPDRDR
jgi:hypothetical protein